MKHLVFTWEYGAGFGHLMPIKVLANKLLERGHTISIVVPEPEAARLFFANAQFNLYQAPKIPISNPKPLEQTLAFSHSLFNACFWSGEMTKKILREWRALFQKIQPDAVITDYSPNALLVARCMQLPRGIMGTGFFIPPPVSPMPRYNNRISFKELVHFENGMLAMINRILKQLDWPLLETLADLFNDSCLHILQGFAELDHYGARKNKHYLGFWSTVSGKEANWPRTDLPQVYFYLKPLPALEKFLHLLEQQNWSCIVFQEHISEQEAQQLSNRNITVTNQLLDIEQVAKQSDIFVSNGNAATVSQFLLMGIACFCAPIQMEQVLFSKRVRKLGAAELGLIEHEENFFQRLNTMMSKIEQYQAAARQFAEKHKNWDQEKSIQQASTLIEGILPD